MDNNNANTIFSMFKNNVKTPVSYYVMFLATYIISFFCIFTKNAELIGHGLLYAINIFATIFVFKDLYIKAGTNIIIFIPLIITLVLNIVSTSLFIVSISRIFKHSNQNGKMVLSYKNRRKFNTYRDLIISELVLLWVLLIYIFVSKNPTLNNITFNITGLLEFAKIGMLLYVVGISAYLVYHANSFERTTRALI
jgi:hypothetical protein